MLDIVEKEERRSMRKARSEVHAITRENFDVIRSDLSSTAARLLGGKNPELD